MLLKNTLRDIKNSKARFLSIMLIIMIGVGFFTGIKSSNPSMMAVVDKYYEDTRLMDYRLVSTVGFDEDDIKALEAIDGVTQVEGSYYADVFLGGEKGGSVVRLHTYPTDDASLNLPIITNGRAPANGSEAVVGGSGLETTEIGTEVAFDLADSDIGDLLAETEFTVVGQVDSPLYISFDRGTTNIGNGSISAYMLLPEESFAFERYTEVFVRTEISDVYAPYTDEYDEAIEKTTAEFEEVGAQQVEVFYQQNVVSAQSSLDEVKTDFENEKEKVLKELDDAKTEINDGWEEYNQIISDSESRLDSAKAQIDEGKEELEKSKAEFESEISKAEQTLADSKTEIESGKAEIAEAKAQVKSAYAEMLYKLQVPQTEMEKLTADKDMPNLEDLDYLKFIADNASFLLDSNIFSLNQQKSDFEKLAEAMGIDLGTNAEYLALTEQLNKLESQKADMEYFLLAGYQQMADSISSITAKEKELSNAEDELVAAEKALEDKKTAGEQELQKAADELALAESQYNTGIAELERTKTETKSKLEDAEKEYEANLSKAMTELEDAERKLNEAQAEIDSVPEAEWYVFDRSDNPGYSSYLENVSRVDAVASVFPIFFLLVAVLVCVTTMTRLIEEKRADIGALITLGYKKGDIVKKFLIYSMSATVIGSVLGVAVGVLALPAVIFEAYGIIYSLPDIILKTDWATAIIATAAALISTSAVTVIACVSLLRLAPATLLRPKAPKPGKRIILERIDFIWSKMNFTAKVTARNIFRYKARFFMTVIGVAGCTALILASFGLHNSVGDIIGLQFEDICTYDAVMVPANEEDSVEFLVADIEADKRIDTYVLCRQTAISVESDTKKVGEDVNLVVPEDYEAHAKLVNLRERISQKPLDLSSDGVVISEKLANTLGVSEGDAVSVKDGDDIVSLTVDGICENYVTGYLYISRDTYTKTFERDFEGNMILTSLVDNSEDVQSEIGTEYLEKDYVLGVSFVSNSTEQFREMIKSLTFVVIVVLICAAGLAFVVLYNLTNINIAERKREISTLKVLGFNSGETSAYIYRENIILTVIGIALGLVFGIFLHTFIVVTIEVDMVMFARTVHGTSYVLAGLMTMLFAALVNIIMHLRIKKIDMIESLKSVE